MSYFLSSLWWASVILIVFFAILWVSDRIIEWRHFRKMDEETRQFKKWWLRR